MTRIIAETRYALRVLARSRAYTAVAVLTLAVSMGANTAIFSMADAIVNRPFAFPGLHRIMSVSSTIPKVDSSRYPVSPADYFDWVERNRVFARLAASQSWDVRLTGNRDPQPVRAALVSPGFFQLIGVAPFRGRTFTTDSERRVVVVSYGFWQQQLRSDPAVVGRPLELNGQAYTIAGIMPKHFDFPVFTDVWAPWIPSTAAERAERAAGNLSVIGRLAPSVSVARARAEMNLIAAGLARQYPATNAGRGIDLIPLSDSVDPYAGRYVTVVAAAVTFLLLLACANVANIQLLRCAVRNREIALRAALGATRGRIARQLLIEGVVLSLAGAALGLPLAGMMLGLIKTSIPAMVMRHLPGLTYAGLNSNMLFWTLVAAIVTGIAFTLPAVLQVSTDHMYETLKDGGRGSVGTGGHRLRSALVVGEVAFALVLLTGAASILRTVRALQPAKQGFDPANVYTFSMRAPEFQYGGDRQVIGLYRETLRRLNALPAIRSAALTSELPALGDSRSGAVSIENQPAPPPERPILAELRISSPDYFQTLGIPLLGGRAFNAQDDASGEPVAIVSRSAAQKFWPRQDAIGRRLRVTSGNLRTGWLKVVGIAGDVNQFFLDAEIRPEVYVCYLQVSTRSMEVVLEPVTATERTASAVRDAMAAVDPSQPVYALESLNKYFVDLVGGIAVIATLIAAFALLSLVLSATGIYAVMHYSVTQRTPEIGIRIALGARPSAVGKMIVGDALRMTAVGVGMALPATWATGRMMTSLMAGIVGLAPQTLAGAALLVAASAILASYLPARRATRIDPLTAIRDQ